jgi:hypothetical protein
MTAVNADVSNRLRPRDLSFAVELVESVCLIAGAPDYLDGVRAELKSFRSRALDASAAIAAAYDWLVRATSYQGISDEVARNYMADHGVPTWGKVAESLEPEPDCGRLASFWHFVDCHYRKGEQTCAALEHLAGCPLPRQRLRNGNLNQLAYSLYLFSRDVAANDLIGWIDAQLSSADEPNAPDRVDRMREALLTRLKGIFGVSDKVLNMVFAEFLLGAGRRGSRWLEVGGSMVAIDTLVHNAMARTGILARARAEHLYGPACYGSNGCADVIRAISAQIDARTFNPIFPANFPRYVQRCIWRFCSQEGFGVCNGLKIDDRFRCEQVECRLYGRCDRRPLSPG